MGRGPISAGAVLVSRDKFGVAAKGGFAAQAGLQKFRLPSKYLTLTLNNTGRSIGVLRLEVLGQFLASLLGHCASHRLFKPVGRLQERGGGVCRIG